MARALAVIEAGLGFAFSRRGHWIFADDLFVIFPARDRNFPARCPGRLASVRGGIVVQVRKLSATGGARPDFQRLGTMGGGSAGEPSFVSRAEFFRSQHNNQSWLGALITILDASALVIAGVDGLRNEQAKITFAMARHAVVDLAQVVNARYDPNVRRPVARGGTEPAARKAWQSAG